MKRALLAIFVSLLLPGAAAAATDPVSIEFQDFGPSRLDVLPGDTVEWTNVSERRHTVTADDESFDSGDMFSGDKFARSFDAPRTIGYHCTVHQGMVGEIDVEPVILGPLPTAAVPAGDPVEFAGRTSDPSQPVRLERAVGGGFQTVGSATPAPDGTWTTTLPASATGDYRAAIASGASTIRHLLVSDRKVVVRATRRGIAVTVTPSLPYGRILVEEDLLERFGWWPAIRGRLDYVSSASFRIKRPARVRVLLVDKDGWTALATSPVLALGHVKHTPAPMTPGMPM